ncbi:MAG TPA: hypothetical protein VFD32_12870 [Dehalococcoidia bacterium]|nr:hypothetical protein [Dehalococcoidia bacterium]
MAEAFRSERVPYLRVILEIPEIRYQREPEALIDTGFTQGAAVPAELLPPGVAALSDAPIRLADGELRYVPAYLAAVRIGATRIDFVSIFEMGNEPIIGLDINTQFRVTIDHAVSMTFEP